MVETNKKSVAVSKAPVDALGVPDFSPENWSEEQVGFSPYWNPEEGKSFIGRLVEKDERDPNFVRYLIQAGEDLECARGPSEEAETVIVKKGEFFTISVYFSLQGVFDLYLESGIRAWMKVTATGISKTKTPGRTVWQWKLQVPKEAKRLADAYRMQLMQGRKEEEAKELTS